MFGATTSAAGPRNGCSAGPYARRQADGPASVGAASSSALAASRGAVAASAGVDASRLGGSLETAARDEHAGADPQQLARVIARIADSRRPKLRYVVGPSAQEWLMRLRYVLPGRWLIARHYGA